ncbi:MAG TPA: F0F1 ATP synthase subunit A [Longimicrobiales bacterium]|nr:F0F1 ATP synthase subunit A [Longimicrobiales bacterium]
MTIVSALSMGAVAQSGEGFNIKDMILHHLADSRELDWPGGPYHLWSFDPVHIGPLTLDFSITKHVAFMLIAATLAGLTLVLAGRSAARARAAGSETGPKGAANVVEAFVLYLRDEVAMPAIGHGGERFVPYIIGVFFFILFSNLLGLVPWGASPTGNISVTAALALLSFLIIEFAGMRALGPSGYAKTIFYAPPGLGPVGTLLVGAIMTPVEFLSKLTKPFALAVRLFANMTAGHAVVLALTGLLVLAQASNVIWAAPAPLVMAVAIMLLEIFVAFIQAYIFAMLTAVFIGLIRHPH